MTLDELLAQHPAAVRSLVMELRALVREVLPGLTEKVLPGWHALGFRDAEAGHLCALFPFDDRVQLVFEHGARLPDPSGVLERRDLKQTRYFTGVPGRPRPDDALAGLLVAALHHGRLRVSMRRRGR